eukprot:jgi/Undpi1/12867/HiC_scaffold_7.g02534.m1
MSGEGAEHGGATVTVKVLVLGDPATGKTSIIKRWDRFGSIARAYYKEAYGAILVYDVGRTSSFETVPRWKGEIDDKVRLPDGSRLPVVLLANKCDLDVAIDKEALNWFCDRHGFVGWFETSAKLNINIEEASHFLVQKVLEKMPTSGVPSSRMGMKSPLEGASEFNSHKKAPAGGGALSSLAQEKRKEACVRRAHAAWC